MGNFVKKLKIGNCFLNGLLLYLTKPGGKLKLSVREGTYIPHLLIDYGDKFIHFRVTRNILPFPFCYLFFIGKFEEKFK